MAQALNNQGNSDKTRNLESKLRETVERYELVFRATNDVLYEINLDTGAVLWNEALYTQYGYDREEESGTLEWWAQHVHPDDALRIEDEISVWLNGPEDTWQAEYRFRKADDSYVHVRDRGFVQRDQEGRPLRIIGSFLDITVQKQLEHGKDEFISLVSHQLRTPLTIIRTYSDMLRAGSFGPISSYQSKQLHKISEASIRLIKLVSDILDVSKLELGIEPKASEVDINKYIRLCIKDVRPYAKQRGIVIKYHPAEGLGAVVLDTFVFGQVLNNLLTNSIRYTSFQKGRIDVMFSKVRGGYLLTVKDDGIGIPKNSQHHIFKRFYRASNISNIKEHGTGLGLYIVKQLVDSVGYKIWFESVADQGTTFYVKLPKKSRVLK